jgi:hypothetical protein
MYPCSAVLIDGRPENCINNTNSWRIISAPWELRRMKSGCRDNTSMLPLSQKTSKLSSRRNSRSLGRGRWSTHVGKTYYYPLDMIDGKFLGDGIFNSDGQVWSTSRALLRPQFQKQRISELEAFELHTNKLLSLIPSNGETFDIMDLWYRFTLDASTEFLFGHSVNSLDNPKARTDVKDHSLIIGCVLRGLCSAANKSRSPG